jgi:hypothetical protein
MPTIQQILAERNVLIRESAALNRLRLPVTPKSQAWLRSRINPVVAVLPRRTLLYRLLEIDRLKLELDQLDHIPRRTAKP